MRSPLCLIPQHPPAPHRGMYRTAFPVCAPLGERLCQRTPKDEPASQTARQNNGNPVAIGSPTRGLPEGYTIRIPPEIRPL